MLAAAAVAVCAMIAGGSIPPAQAEVRLTVPGAGPLYYPRLIADLPIGRTYLLGTDEENGYALTVLEGYALLNRMIGENWFPGSTPHVVDYPASIGLVSGSLAAPGVEEGVEMGRVSLDEQIKAGTANGDEVAIAALSEGTLVINRELASLAKDPHAPGAGLLSFVMFAGPELGLARVYLPEGATIPLINYTQHDLADSQYDVTVVFHQYEGWPDPPDRPWHLLSVANSLIATMYFHNSTALAAPSDAVEISTVTSDLGGTTTTKMIGSPTLPLLKPLQQIGVPKPIVNVLNAALKPIVDAGYSRLTPDAGPYFSHGRLRTSPPPMEEPTSTPRGDAPLASTDEDTTSAVVSGTAKSKNTAFAGATKLDTDDASNTEDPQRISDKPGVTDSHEGDDAREPGLDTGSGPDGDTNGADGGAESAPRTNAGRAAGDTGE